MDQVATLNDERDWRNGMRVKLLNRVVISMTLHLYFWPKRAPTLFYLLQGKYGQRRQAWRGYDSEKNSTSRGSDHTGDEENHNLSEHHDDTPDEEVSGVTSFFKHMSIFSVKAIESILLTDFLSADYIHFLSREPCYELL